MRVNPNMVPAVLAAIARTQRSEEKAIRELSTGKRVNMPSDDPAASAAFIENRNRSGLVDQFTENVVTLKDMMQMADSSLGDVIASVTRAISLGVQGGDGTLSSANRQALAEQVKGIAIQIIAEANTVHKGIYLFGGTDNTTPPFVADSTQPSGYRYDGNSGVNEVRIGEGLDVSVNVPGDEIFMAAGADLFGALNSLITSLESGTQAQIATATSDLRTAMDRVSQKRVFYGNAMNQMNAQDQYLQKQMLNLQTQETSLVGMDPARAAIELTQAQVANSAALAAAARVLPETLLNYLK